MGRNPPKTAVLENGSRIAVLGAGPAGSFFAIHLLEQARKKGLHLKVTLIDPRIKTDQEGRVTESSGCNQCAGLISPGLVRALGKSGMALPEQVRCEAFSHIWIHGLWKNFPLKVPEGDQILSVFRGTLPRQNPLAIGMDAFLVQQALKRGAGLWQATALDLALGPAGRPSLSLVDAAGQSHWLETDFTCICTGVNTSVSGLIQSFARLNPSYHAPRTRPALIFELRPGKAYLRRHIHREVHIIVSAAKGLDLDHAALIPKGDCLTIALMGKSVDRADLDQRTPNLIRAFLRLPGVKDVIPRADRFPILCTCTPRMVVAPAQEAFAHRIGLAGDAFGANLYRDGLYSAFTLTRILAKTVVHRGVDAPSLGQFYRPAQLWLARDNKWGRQIMGLMQSALKSKFFSRLLYQTFATEMKSRPMDKWPMGRLLWQIGSGAADYRQIGSLFFSGPVLLSLARGAVKTIRNTLTELFFGLNWEGVGRYPTVIIREKRDHFKASVCRSMGVSLLDAPDMERMYAVKIRATAEEIFRVLGCFGSPKSSFLALRFVDVARIRGKANQEGTIVRYRLNRTPLAMELKLTRALPGKGLIYEPSQLFAAWGRLIFEIRSTRDGNNRLLVYTAFNYRQGRSLSARLFWAGFRRFFPDFAHDVVWNHAICRIKGEAEQVSVNKEKGMMGELPEHTGRDAAQKPPFHV